MERTMSETVNEHEHEHELILASRVNGTPVYNQAEERLGHIDDLSIEKISGKVKYAIMSFGGFLGIGDRFHPIPWSLLDYNIEKGGYVVPLDRAALKGAPHYDRTELRDLGGADHRNHGELIFGYYSPYGYVGPYW